ncbi:hypothetical protein V8Z74_10475 [Comamonas sp. w2-DMI]|uniref:hypothetical protein n=1 Tax=Comamonas sp. w2-DMI TaxID=3126391 RepID=UPI0032E3891F
MPYQPYWKSEFQNLLTSLKGQGNLVSWQEVSDKIESSDYKIWEYVYEYKLRNPAASIIIFSSIYKQDDRSRDINSDAVRIIYEWRTKSGKIYSKISKKYRVDSLFKNLKEELIKASNKSFELQQYEWTDSIKDTDAR